MGADAEIFVFDYERYRTEIVPALVTLLRTGRPVPWLAEIFRREPSDGYGWSRMSFPPTDLAARLGALPLPRFEASFAAMHERHRLSMSRPDDDWDAVSLAFVRTVSGLAADEGRGVLWGNDVIARIWTELYGVRPA